MRYISTKNASDVTLAGIGVELDVVGDKVHGITLSDAEGRSVRVALRDWSSLQVEIPAPPKTKTVHRLSGSVLGLAVSEDFEHEHEANAARSKYESGANETDLSVGPVVVVVPDDTTYIQNGADDDLPF